MTEVIAHRGASADRPENTVAAFAEAVRQGADGVELDVRRSRDGALVVCHDAAYADGRDVVSVDLADVPDGVVDLATALDACGPLAVNVEIKNLPFDAGFDDDLRIADEVARELLDRGRPDRYLVSSFHLPTIDRVREVAPVLATAFLFFSGIEPKAAIDLAAARGHQAVHPHAQFVDEAFMAAARDAGLVVNVWTVDDPAEIARLAALGVDGIVTNTPALARAALTP